MDILAIGPMLPAKTGGESLLSDDKGSSPLAQPCLSKHQVFEYISYFTERANAGMPVTCGKLKPTKHTALRVTTGASYLQAV
jgi:hypothetical protein